MDNYYKILGLDNGASIADVKSAYRELAKKYHPDINPSPHAKQVFIRITEAYQCLTDPQKKYSHEQRKRRAQGRSAANSTRSDLNEEWMRQRQQEARRRAEEFARMNYTTFRQTQTFRSTMRHYIPQFAGCLIAGIFTISLIAFLFKFSSVLGVVAALFSLPTIALLFQYWENWRKRW
ncbi:MAG: J domain-containing protein [Bacteroidia bacterium]|nr:J domain-containing protein [Bacteroidia bacterium]